MTRDQPERRHAAACRHAAPLRQAPGDNPGAQPAPGGSGPGQPGPRPAAGGKAASRPSGWGKLWAAFGFGALLFFIYMAVQVAGAFHMLGFGLELNPVLAGCELFAGAVGIFFVVAMGGTTIAKPRVQGFGAAWKAAIALFAVDGLFVALEVAEVVTGAESIDIAADWPMRMLVLALLCLGVGLFEEALMRGLCLNGLLARMGTSRAGVFGAVVLSSALFGFMHFDFFIDFGDPLQVAQNFMKVLQAGMAGYLFAAIVVKTRNLWAAVSVHAANDFMLMFLAYGLTAETVTTEYVSTGEEGVAVLTAYIVLCLLYIPMMIVGTRMIGSAGIWRGDFYRYGEAEGTVAVVAPAGAAVGAGAGLGAYPYPMATPVVRPAGATAPPTEDDRQTHAVRRAWRSEGIDDGERV